MYFQSRRRDSFLIVLMNQCRCSPCCCLTAQGRTDCPGSGPSLSDSERHWTHPTLLDTHRQQSNFTHGRYTSYSWLWTILTYIYTYTVCTVSMCVYRGWSSRQSQADCRLVCCCYWEVRREEAPHLSQNHCQTKHWEERRGEERRGEERRGEERRNWVIYLNTYLWCKYLHFIQLHVHVFECFVHWQAGVSSDFGRVVGADDKVALLLWEFRRKLQVWNQVHHVVVTR